MSIGEDYKKCNEWRVNKMRFISCASYYGSGSSAITDFVSEYRIWNIIWLRILIDIIQDIRLRDIRNLSIFIVGIFLEVNTKSSSTEIGKNIQKNILML